jgi:hypothetical protein
MHMFLSSMYFWNHFHINWCGILQGTLSEGLLHALVPKVCIENEYHAISYIFA